MEQDVPHKHQSKESQNGHVNIKVDVRAKKITRDKGGHHMMITGSVHQGEKTILNAEALNNKASKHVKQTPTLHSLFKNYSILCDSIQKPFSERQDYSDREEIDGLGVRGYDYKVTPRGSFLG